MKRQIGIWVDSSMAFIVSGDERGELRKIESHVEFKERVEGEGKKFGQFGNQFIDLERPKERRLEQQLDKYLDNIIQSVTDASEIVVFGPAQMKNRLQKRFANDARFTSIPVRTETADSMTEPQMRAWVRDFFGSAN